MLAAFLAAATLTAVAVHPHPVAADVTAGAGAVAAPVSFAPGVTPILPSLGGSCAGDTLSSGGSLAAGAAVVNSQNVAYVGLVQIGFSNLTSSCSNMLGDSAASGTLTLSGQNGPAIISCSFTVAYVRVGPIDLFDGPGSCTLDVTPTGTVFFSERGVLAPLNTGAGVLSPMTSALLTAGWDIGPDHA